MLRVATVLLLVLIVSPWVIYRRNHKKRLICKEEVEWSNNTMADDDDDDDDDDGIRQRRDIHVDPERKEAIIYLGNSSSVIDDGDFDIVSEHLTPTELKEVKKQIMATCNALNSYP